MVMMIIQVGLYVLVGCVVSIPYTYLAGGSFDGFAFIMTAWIAPAGVLSLFLIYVSRQVPTPKAKGSNWGGALFWLLLAYLCLPIIANGASRLLMGWGYEEIGAFVFLIRYRIIFILPLTSIVIIGVADMVESVLKDFSRSRRLDR
jgi:hypothetical protein